MSDLIIDSSVVAKWILPEADSPKAQQLLTQAAASGDQLLVVDMIFPEVANAIWKRQRQRLITQQEAHAFLEALRILPVRIEPALGCLGNAFDIAVKYDRAVYDALFVALARERGLDGITADEPLYNAVRHDFPNIRLLRNM